MDAILRVHVFRHGVKFNAEVLGLTMTCLKTYYAVQGLAFARNALRQVVYYRGPDT
jgi:hypothetical protein